MDRDRAELFAQEILKTVVELEVNMVVSHNKDQHLKRKETAESIGELYQDLLAVYLAGTES
ncbi:MAG: hypothetical protein HN790_12630 [Methylococcales bacterium]|jgi:hypothetical protein|nr:hypothetical protein [Methylococcales bacterium]